MTDEFWEESEKEHNLDKSKKRNLNLQYMCKLLDMGIVFKVAHIYANIND